MGHLYFEVMYTFKQLCYETHVEWKDKMTD